MTAPQNNPIESKDHFQFHIRAEDSIQQAIQVIESGTSQIALVVGENGKLLGTATDGDIRRGFLRGIGLDGTVREVMNPHPTTAHISTPKKDLMELMTSCSIRQVPLVDGDGRVAGLELLDRLLGAPALLDNCAIILAGGRGTRLRPLTSDTPKPLLKIGGRPVLALIIQQLRAHGIHRIYISLNYLGNQIKEYLGDGRDLEVSIEYLVEPEPLGTAGPISLMPKPAELPFLVVNGDLVTKVNFENLIRFHQEGGFSLTAGVKEISQQLPFGVVVTDGEQIVGLHEKPIETRLVNTGVYAMDPNILELVPRNTYYDMNTLIDSLIADPEKTVGAFVIHEYWMDIGTPADYLRAQGEYFAYFADHEDH